MITEKIVQELYVAFSPISLQERRLEAKEFDTHTTTPIPFIRRKSWKQQYIPSSTWRVSESASIQKVNQHLTPTKKSPLFECYIMKF